MRLSPAMATVIITLTLGTKHCVLQPLFLPLPSSAPIVLVSMANRPACSYDDDDSAGLERRL